MSEAIQSFYPKSSTLTDRNSNVHTYTHDVLGRTTLDAVTTLGTGVDGAIRALGYTFDTGGRPYQDTSYSNAAGTTVVNQVQFAYDPWGQEAVEYQEDSGAVNTSTSANVQYNHTENAGGVNNDRLVSMVYPSDPNNSNASRVVDYRYGSAEYPLTGITHSGTTATATMGSNVYTTGSSVTISGATPSAYDGTFTVTAVNTSAHTFSYTMASTPGSNATGLDLTVTTPGTTLDGAVSRVTAEMDHAGSSAGVDLEQYSYLGLGTIVAWTRPEDHTQLTYIQVSGDTHYNGDGGDRYTGLDRFGRVIDQYWLETNSSPTAVDRFQYAYDRDGDVLYRKNLVNAAFSELYHANSAASGDNNTAYDPQGRLTSFLRGTLTSSGNNGTGLDTITNSNVNTLAGSAATWTLDDLGNWSSSAVGAGSGSSSAPSLTSTSRTNNRQNQATAIGSATVTYDNAGNTTKNSVGYTLKYDAWNRLVYSGYSTPITYTYDALGRMVKWVNNNTDYFHYDSQGNQITCLSNGLTYYQYVWGQGGSNDLILRDRNTDTSYSTGNYGVTGSGMEERLYVQQDANGDVTSLITPAQTVDERIVYDPYGKPTTLTSAWASFTDTSYYFRVLFQGEEWLNEANVYQMGARDFDFSMGRWDQQDPAGYIDGSSLYQGFAGNPGSLNDPSGLQAVDPFAAADEFAANNPLLAHGYRSETANPQQIWDNNMAELAREAQAAANRQIQLAADLARAIAEGVTGGLYKDPCPNADAHRAAPAILLVASELFPAGEIGSVIDGGEALPGLEEADQGLGAADGPGANAGPAADGGASTSAPAAAETPAATNPLFQPGPFAGESIPARSAAQTFTQPSARP